MHLAARQSLIFVSEPIWTRLEALLDVDFILKEHSLTLEGKRLVQAQPIYLR